MARSLTIRQLEDRILDRMRAEGPGDISNLVCGQIIGLAEKTDEDFDACLRRLSLILQQEDATAGPASDLVYVLLDSYGTCITQESLTGALHRLAAAVEGTKASAKKAALVRAFAAAVAERDEEPVPVARTH